MRISLKFVSIKPNLGFHNIAVSTAIKCLFRAVREGVQGGQNINIGALTVLYLFQF